MLDANAQLSSVEVPRVVVLWHRTVSPPDSVGPFDTAYEAALESRPELNGWGRSEEAAIEALAGRLRALASGPPVANSLTAVGQRGLRPSP